MDQIIEKEIFSNWKIIKQLEDLGFQLIHLTDSFISINNHIGKFNSSKRKDLFYLCLRISY